jgi:hypothetical protein
MLRAALATTLVIFAGCRPGEGERCFCEGECRGGFVCAAEGAVLGEGQCVDAISDSIESGTCIEVTNLEGDTDELVPQPYYDLGNGWATDPAVTTLPGTDGPMTTTVDGTTSQASTTDATTTGTGATTMDTDAATDTDTTSSTTSGSTGATTGTAGAAG